MKYLLFFSLFFIASTEVIAQVLDVEGDVEVNGRIMNVADPVDDQDAATMAYVDQVNNLVNEENLEAGLFGIVQDVDGNIYKTIKIGDQVWMAENLKTTKFNDGTDIFEQEINGNWTHFITPAYCWFGNDSISFSQQYGAIYNYFAVADTTTKNICPVGWDVPTRTELTILNDFLSNRTYGFEGSGSDIGKSLAVKYRWDASATAGHVGNDTGSNNSSLFSLFPAGFRSSSTGEYFEAGRLGLLWSSTEDGADNTKAFRRGLGFGDDVFGEFSESKFSGFSVRCIRD